MQQTISVTDVLTELEAASRLGVSISGLRKWRNGGTGPKFVRLGRLIRYRVRDLEIWLNDRTVSSDDKDKSAASVEGAS